MDTNIHHAGTPVAVGRLLNITLDRHDQTHEGTFEVLRPFTQDDVEGLARVVRAGRMPLDGRVVERMVQEGWIKRIPTGSMMIDVDTPRPVLLIP